MLNGKSLKRVVLTGATGAIGSHVTHYLTEKGYDVTALIRDRTRAGDIPSSVNISVGDVTKIDSLIEAFNNKDAVVHMAVAKSDENYSYDVNVVGAKNLIAACHYRNISRIVNISTLSAKITKKGPYGETKALADEAFHSSGLDVITLRASIIYGPELLGVFGQLVNVIKRFPLVPVIGNGKWMSRPMDVRDLSYVIEAVLNNKDVIANIYDVGGPDEVTFDQLIDLVSEILGRKLPKVHFPYFLALPAVRLMALLISNPPVTVSNVLGSNQDVEFDTGSLTTYIKFTPRRLIDGLKEVLGSA